VSDLRSAHRQPALTSTVVQYENREVVGSKDSKADSKSDLEDITQDWTVAEETALRRKIDRRIVPLVTVLYLLCVCRPDSLGPGGWEKKGTIGE
jgi:hypothetical protein